MIINEDLLYRALHQQPLRQLTLKTSNHVINVQTVTKKRKLSLNCSSGNKLILFQRSGRKKPTKKKITGTLHVFQNPKPFSIIFDDFTWNRANKKTETLWADNHLTPLRVISEQAS